MYLLLPHPYLLWYSLTASESLSVVDAEWMLNCSCLSLRYTIGYIFMWSIIPSSARSRWIEQFYSPSPDSANVALNRSTQTQRHSMKPRSWRCRRTKTHEDQDDQDLQGCAVNNRNPTVWWWTFSGTGRLTSGVHYSLVKFFVRILGIFFIS